MTATVAIGVDLGGTNLKAAVVDQEARILAKGTMPTAPERGPDAVIADIVELTDDLIADRHLARARVAGVGVGTPGPLSYRQGRIIKAANLPGWHDVDLRDRLAERLHLPVVVDNDANAAAFGEHWAGAGRDGADLVLLTLGTGVGSGVVTEGRVLRGHFENAGELGHMIVAVDGLPCPCGQRGCLEQYASAGAVARRVAAAVAGGETSSAAEAVEEGNPLDARLVAAHARQGDILCNRIWDEACLYLAVACINIQHAFNPARVVLGGGMSEAGAFLSDRVNDHLRRQRWSLHDDVPAVVLSRLGPEAGVIGAAALVLIDAPPG